MVESNHGLCSTAIGEAMYFHVMNVHGTEALVGIDGIFTVCLLSAGNTVATCGRLPRVPVRVKLWYVGVRRDVAGQEETECLRLKLKLRMLVSSIANVQATVMSIWDRGR